MRDCHFAINAGTAPFKDLRRVFLSQIGRGFGFALGNFHHREHVAAKETFAAKGAAFLPDQIQVALRLVRPPVPDARSDRARRCGCLSEARDIFLVERI